jgi:hypothetical protein
VPSKRAEGMTTLTVSTERDLAGAAKAKAKAEGRDMSAVVRGLLRRWVDGEITTPPPADRTG